MKLCFKINDKRISSLHTDFLLCCCCLAIKALTIKNGCQEENVTFNIQTEKASMEIDCTVITGGGTRGNRNYLDYLEVSRVWGKGKCTFSFFLFSFYDCTCSIWKFLGQGPTEAAAATYASACSNARSLTHWARPGIKPKCSQTQHQVLNLLSHRQLPELHFLKWNYNSHTMLYEFRGYNIVTLLHVRNDHLII